MSALNYNWRTTMSQFPTLFQLTGSEHPAAQWQDAVLVIIDAQNEYRIGDMKLPDVEPATVQIQQLLAAARAWQPRCPYSPYRCARLLV